jgi:hypothetical protein
MIMNDKAFHTLVEYLQKIPGINASIGKGTNEDGLWWIKFQIDITHPLAWHCRK